MNAISGAYVALLDALAARRAVFGPAASIVRGSVAAVSVGVVDGTELLDLDYSEDKDAEVRIAFKESWPLGRGLPGWFTRSTSMS